MIEIKPLRQCSPHLNQRGKLKNILVRRMNMQNQAKGKQRKFCRDRRWEFKVMTEKELGIK